MSQWTDLKINWQEKFDFSIYDIKGELSTDEPKVLSLPLARADDLTFQNIRGEVIIKKLENTFEISSRGSANSIQQNDIDILNENESNKENLGSIVENPLIITMIAIIGTVASILALLFRRSSRSSPSITIRQNQNGNQFTIASIQNVGNASATNINCRITNRTTGESIEVNPMALTPNQAINIPPPDRLTGMIGDKLQIEFEYTDISGKRRKRNQKPFTIRKLTQRTQQN